MLPVSPCKGLNTHTRARQQNTLVYPSNPSMGIILNIRIHIGGGSADMAYPHIEKRHAHCNRICLLRGKISRDGADGFIIHVCF